MFIWLVVCNVFFLFSEIQYSYKMEMNKIEIGKCPAKPVQCEKVHTYAVNVWILSDPVPDLVQNDPPVNFLQFIIDGKCLAGTRCQQRCEPLWYTASYFEKLCIHFWASTLRSLSTCVFPNRCKLSYVMTPIFK
jgi:hypothetical protein